MKQLAVIAALLSVGFTAQAQTTVAAQPIPAPTAVAVAQQVRDVPEARYRAIKPAAPAGLQPENTRNTLAPQLTPLDELNVGLEILHPRAIPSYKG